MKEGKIYKMENEYGIYYGSTTKSLKDRLRVHRDKRNTTCSKSLFTNGSEPKIELLEIVQFTDIYDLKLRERYYIENLECINKVIPCRTPKEYREDNKEKIAEKKKKYRQANKEKIAEYKKKWTQANKEKLTEYRQANKEKIAEYYQTNKEKIRQRYSVKITCDCGSVVTKHAFSRHKKSKKHMKYIETNITI